MIIDTGRSSGERIRTVDEVEVVPDIGPVIERIYQNLRRNKAVFCPICGHLVTDATVSLASQSFTITCRNCRVCISVG